MLIFLGLEQGFGLVTQIQRLFVSILVSVPSIDVYLHIALSSRFMRTQRTGKLLINIVLFHLPGKYSSFKRL